MRVANVIEEGKIGGPQVRMVRVGVAFKSRVKTIIVMPRANSARFRELCADTGIDYRVVPLTRITKEWRAAIAYCIFSPFEILSLARLFRREVVDVVHASGGSWQYKAVIAARLAKVPLVWHVNDTAMPAWVRQLFRFVQPWAAGFIFASHRSQEYYGDVVGTRPQAVIPAAVDTDAFVPEPCISAVGRELTGLDNAITIGTIANLNRIKGIETMIAALGVLHQRGRDVHLTIVGSVFENQKTYYRRLLSYARSLDVAENIHWAGSQSDVRPWLQGMGVYVCSSRAESSPMSVWEAMAMARPVVSTDVGDVPRHVVDGENGFIVPVADAKAMAARIETLLDDEDLRRRFGERGRQVAVENFSLDKVAKATGDFYEEVLAYWRHQRGTAARCKCKGLE